jgi:hypothetical protein
MDEIFLDPEKFDLFLARVHEPFAMSGLMNSCVAPAIEGVPALGDALQGFADHWDIDIDIVIGNVIAVRDSLAAAKDLIQKWDAGIRG